MSETLVANTSVETLEREILPPCVYRTSWGNRVFVQIKHHGETIYLGTYETVEAAVEVRDEARRQLGQGLR